MDSKIGKWLAGWFGQFSTVEGCTGAVPYTLNHATRLTPESVNGLKLQSRSFSMKLCLWNLKSYISALFSWDFSIRQCQKEPVLSN